MKQHIEPKDLEQLTKKGKEKLLEWWKPQYGDTYFFDDAFGGEFLVIWYEKHDSGYEQIQNEICDYDGCPEFNDKEKSLPLLSLGQMIDFLADKKLFVPYNNNIPVDFFGVSKTGDGSWYVGVDGSDELASTDHVKLELCDALWSACLEILNKE